MWYDYENILLQKGLNDLQKISGEKLANRFIQDLFYYIVQIFHIWLHKSDFIVVIVA